MNYFLHDPLLKTLHFPRKKYILGVKSHHRKQGRLGRKDKLRNTLRGRLATLVEWRWSGLGSSGSCGGVPRNCHSRRLKNVIVVISFSTTIHQFTRIWIKPGFSKQLWRKYGKQWGFLIRSGMKSWLWVSQALA